MRGSTNSTAPARAGAGSAAGHFAVALAAAAALLAFAAVQRNPQHAAESGYLALLATLVLAAVAALPRRRPAGGSDLFPWAAVLTVLGAVALPPGAGRGAALLALLAATLAAALHAALAGAPRRWLDEVALLLPAAVAVQVLFRGGELLAAAPERRVLVLFVALPVAGAAASAWLAVRHGRGAVLVAAALALLACDGLDVTSTVVLVALAAGELLARPPGGRALRWAWRAAAAAALLAPFAWQPRSAALALAAALAVAALGSASWPVAGLVGGSLAVAGLVAALALPVAGWGEAGGRLALAWLLVPLWPLAFWRGKAGRASPAVTVALVALALAAARCAPAEAMAAPLALAALAAWAGAGATGERTLAGDEKPTGQARLLRAALAATRPRPGLVAQAAWCALLLAGAALAAAYPWLRDEPVRAVLDASRLPTAGWGAVAGALLVALAALVLVRLPRRAGAVAAAALARFVFAPRPLLAPHAARPLLDRAGAHLTAAEPAVERSFETPLPLDRLVAYGNLSNAAELTQGTPVATVRLWAAAAEGAPDGEAVATWSLEAGVGIAEWAAWRPDVAPTLAHRMPPPWHSWVSPEGDGFGHTYRVAFDPPGAPAVGRVTVERHPELPPGVVVHLERLQAVR